MQGPADKSEPMESLTSEPASPQQSPLDRGKLAAVPPAKEPLLKKQHWDVQTYTNPEENHSDS